VLNMLLPLDRLRSILRRKKIDALLVAQPENRRYLSGYTAADHTISESSGVLLVLAKGPSFLLTDSRYQLQAEKEAHGFDVQLYPNGLLVSLQKLLPTLGIRRLGFEGHYFLHKTAVALIELTRKLAVEAVSLSGLVEKMRVIKTKREIASIKKSVAINEKVFQTIYGDLAAGKTERQVAFEIENTMRILGAEGPSFETIVAGGPNSALPHAVPTDRPLQEGEPIIIDMGTRVDGYCSDMTRTVVLGTPDAKTVELIRLVSAAKRAAIKFIKAGVTAQQADRIARQIIFKQGYGSNFGHGLGHGVGLAVHEAPSLNRHSRKKLLAGMVVTVEPGIYLPGWGGVRLENMVVVGENGCKSLNKDTTFLNL
jgi:Xaa-Pro aminopeptidase